LAFAVAGGPHILFIFFESNTGLRDFARLWAKIRSEE